MDSLEITWLWAKRTERKMSGTSTSQAVSRISEFYLEELAGRRAQVVAEELNTRFSYMENAVAIMDDTNLESQETLRKFFGRVKKLCGFDKFALVDENGIVYTEYTTTSDHDQYDFLSEELTERAIITKNIDHAKKQVILAIPVEGVAFQGRRMKVCFIQIDLEEMLSALTSQTNYNETYWSLYHRNGEDLTNNDFGNLKAGANFLLELRKADIYNGFSYEQLQSDFANGRSGQISFSYMGAQEDLYPGGGDGLDDDGFDQK